MKPDFSKIDIKQVSASKVVGPNNADWQTPELIDVKPIYTKEDLQGMEVCRILDSRGIERFLPPQPRVRSERSVCSVRPPDPPRLQRR